MKSKYTKKVSIIKNFLDFEINIGFQSPSEVKGLILVPLAVDPYRRRVEFITSFCLINFAGAIQFTYWKRCVREQIEMDLLNSMNKTSTKLDFLNGGI